MIALERARAATQAALAPSSSGPGGRLMMLFVSRRAGDARELCAIVRVGRRGDRVCARRLNGDAYPAVTPTIPAAHWFEREIHDLWGIVPEGHPASSRSSGIAPSDARVTAPGRARTRAWSTEVRSGSRVRACS